MRITVVTSYSMSVTREGERERGRDRVRERERETERVRERERERVSKRERERERVRERERESERKNAGYDDDIFPQQAAESNALLFSLVQPLAGYMVKSMRLVPGLPKSRIAATAATAAAPT